jgi:hypothetical protein
MRYLVTTDPRAEAQEIEAPCGSAAAAKALGSSRGVNDHATVYVRPMAPPEWDVFSCVRSGEEWVPYGIGSVRMADLDVADRLRAELREVREVRDRMRDMHDAETMRLRTEILAVGERVRAACVAACRRVESENGDPYDAMSTGRAEGADECSDAIGALDLDSLSENAPSR